LIIAARTAGPFRDLNDFARRVDLRAVGKRSLESLIRVGAMDRFGSRRGLLEVLEQLISVSSSHFRAALSGQMSFFGTVEGVEEEIILPHSAHMDQREQLEWERELLGLFVSDHPLTPYLPGLREKITHFSAQLSETAHHEKVCVAGMVTRFRKLQTKKKDWMGFVTIEDIQGAIELVLFPRAWREFGQMIEPDAVITAEGRMDSASGDPKILVDIVTMAVIEESPIPGTATPFPPVKEVRISRADLEFIFQEDEPIKTEAARRFAEPAPDWESDGPPLPPDPDNWHLQSPDAGILAAPINSNRLPVSQPEKVPSQDGPAEQIIPAPPVAEREVVYPPAALPSAAPAPVNHPPAAFIPVPFMVAPVYSGSASSHGSDRPRMVTVVLRASGNKERDARRLKNVHGVLTSSPGKDHFSLMVFEVERRYLIDFPNETTGISPELVRRLTLLVGEDNFQIEPIKIQ
jgi:DNA polymerase-3 subunit alpha